MQLKQIGVIRSPFQQASGTPIQSRAAEGVEGTVEIFPEFAAGLKDLEGFERMFANRKKGRRKLLRLVDLVGIEPTTSSMPWKRAPSCATGPLEEGIPPRRDSTILAQRKLDSQTESVVGDRLSVVSCQ